MPHFDFDQALREYRKDEPEVELITFTYGGEIFTVRPDPTLGDVMELHDAPEIRAFDDEDAALAIMKFVRRLLSVDDRQRFDQAHFRVPARQSAPAMIQLGTWLTEQVTGFPTQPPVASVSRLDSPGPASSKRTGGTTRSSRPRAGKGSPSSTARQRGA